MGLTVPRDKQEAQTVANPGQDQIAKWKDAVAAHRQAQRRQRGRRPTGPATVASPGMLRVTTARTGEKEGTEGGQSRAPGGPP